ncbi:MAG: hypothetical protein FJY15_06530 [Bacteroidetes bacterium]|nr:hypothetical protein [Bacteroidota bacterium]
MRTLRRHIAFLFIFCTLIVQTPRSWLHDCHGNEFSTFSHAGSTMEEDCDICNQPALLSDDNTAPEINCLGSYNYVFYSDLIASVPFIVIGLIQNKAPPVLPC